MSNFVSLSLFDQRKTTEKNVFKMSDQTPKPYGFVSKLFDLLILFFIFNWGVQNFRPVDGASIVREKRSPFELQEVPKATDLLKSSLSG